MGGTRHMKAEEIAAWLDRRLDVASFDDVSNNGIQIAASGRPVRKIAFGVDASAAFIEKAAAAGAEMCVVHHGISWGGGIRRIAGSEYAVVAAAIRADIALYAVHLPLDANRDVGNNAEIARALGLGDLEPAFTYHGSRIGFVGNAPADFAERLAATFGVAPSDCGACGGRVGVCSGGAGAFAAEAKALGCSIYLTGEADWGEKIAAENAGAKMLLLGHYETETFGVKALAALAERELGIATEFIPMNPTR